jgi:hypothetical protein
MSNDKMREEFEAWTADHSFLGGCHLNRKPEGEYHDVDMQYAWEAWQASREALVIELPKIVGYEGAYDSLQDHEFCPRMSDVDDADEVFGLCRSIEAQEAIEAAGVKVKP